jgi:hypothetical protein
MPYLGNTPSTSFATVVKDAFSGDGSTVAFTLSKVATTNSVSVFVENVRQEPTTAYAVSGTTLTFTAAPVTSSGNNIYVLHMNPTTTTTHPAAQNLTAVNGTLTGTLSVTGASTLTGNVALGGTLDMNGAELVLDADADTSITADTDDRIDFKTGGTDRLQVQSTSGNNVVIADGLTLTDGDVTVASGHGINFAATADGTSASSELLDDYEEGTWQPSLTNGYSYDGLQAHYTKIGNVVYIYASFYRDGFSSNSNTFVITNLPFTPDTSNKTNSNGLGHWSCYNGSTDRRHGMIDTSNDGNVYFIQDGTKAYATYDGVAASDGRGVGVKWFYYTAS